MLCYPYETKPLDFFPFSSVIFFNHVVNVLIEPLGTLYGFQFPASTVGEIKCNPEGGYTDSKYTLYKLPEIGPEMVLTSAAVI